VWKKGWYGEDVWEYRIITVCVRVQAACRSPLLSSASTQLHVLESACCVE